MRMLHLFLNLRCRDAGPPTHHVRPKTAAPLAGSQCWAWRGPPLMR